MYREILSDESRVGAILSEFCAPKNRFTRTRTKRLVKCLPIVSFRILYAEHRTRSRVSLPRTAIEPEHGEFFAHDSHGSKNEQTRERRIFFGSPGTFRIVYTVRRATIRCNSVRSLFELLRTSRTFVSLSGLEFASTFTHDLQQLQLNLVRQLHHLVVSEYASRCEPHEVCSQIARKTLYANGARELAIIAYR